MNFAMIALFHATLLRRMVQNQEWKQRDETEEFLSKETPTHSEVKERGPVD